MELQLLLQRIQSCWKGTLRRWHFYVLFYIIRKRQPQLPKVFCSHFHWPKNKFTTYLSKIRYSIQNIFSLPKKWHLGQLDKQAISKHRSAETNPSSSQLNLLNKFLFLDLDFYMKKNTLFYVNERPKWMASRYLPTERDKPRPVRGLCDGKQGWFHYKGEKSMEKEHLLLLFLKQMQCLKINRICFLLPLQKLSAFSQNAGYLYSNRLFQLDMFLLWDILKQQALLFAQLCCLLRTTFCSSRPF